MPLPTSETQVKEANQAEAPPPPPAAEPVVSESVSETAPKAKPKAAAKASSRKSKKVFVRTAKNLPMFCHTQDVLIQFYNFSQVEEDRWIKAQLKAGLLVKQES